MDSNPLDEDFPVRKPKPESLVPDPGVNIRELAPISQERLNALRQTLAARGVSGRITSGFQHRAQRSAHSSGHAVDVVTPGDMPGLASQLQAGGFRAAFERKGQRNANGSVATGNHIHVTLAEADPNPLDQDFPARAVRPAAAAKPTVPNPLDQDFPPIRKPAPKPQPLYDPTAGTIYANRTLQQERNVQQPIAAPSTMRPGARPGELHPPTLQDQQQAQARRVKGKNVVTNALEFLTPPNTRAALDNPHGGSTEIETAVLKDLGLFRAAGIVGKAVEGAVGLTKLGQRWLASLNASGPVKQALMRTFSPARSAGGAAGGGTFQTAVEAPQDKPLVEKAKAVGAAMAFGAAAAPVAQGFSEVRGLPQALREARAARQSFEGGRAALQLRPRNTAQSPVRDPVPFTRSGKPFAGPAGEPVRPGPVTQPQAGTSFQPRTREPLPGRSMAEAMGVAERPTAPVAPKPQPVAEAPAARPNLANRPTPGIRAPKAEPKATTSTPEPGATGLANQHQLRQFEQGIIDRTPEKGPALGLKKIFTTSKADVESGKIDPYALAREIGVSGRPFTDREGGALLHGAIKLENDVIAKQKAVGELHAQGAAPAAIAQAERDLKAAADLHMQYLDDVQKGKSALSGGFRSLQLGAALDTGNYAQVLAVTRKALGRELNAAEQKKIADLTDQVQKAVKSHADLQAEFERILPELKASRLTAKELKAERAGERVGAAKTRAAKYQAERQGIEVEIKKYLDEVAGSAHSVTGVPYHAAKLGKAGSRWALSYARETGANLDAAVNQTIKDFHERGITISRQEIINELAEHPETQTRDEKQAFATKLKQEARRHQELTSQIEKLKRGEKLETNPSKQAEKAKSIADLEAERNELLKPQRAEARAANRMTPEERQQRSENRQMQRLRTKQMEAEAGIDPGPATPRPPASRELEMQRQQTAQARKEVMAPRQAAEREAAAQARARQQIADLERQLKTGQYAVPTTRERVMSEQLKNLRAKEQLFRNEVARHVESSKPLTKLQKVGNVISAPRSLMTTADLSAPGRQGWKLGLANPRIAKQAFAAQIRAFNPEKAVAQHLDILNRENSHWYRRSGLHISPVGGAGLTHGEEAFVGNLAEKIPVYGKVVAGSERAYVAYLNRLRADTFDRMTSALGPHPKEADMKAVAEFINVATGRGRFGSPDLERGLNVMNHVLFAPRKIIADLEYLPRGLSGGLSSNPQVRQAIQGSTLRTLGSVGAMLGLASLAGAKVSTDRNDSDYLKIRVGDTRIDIGTGILQYLTLADRLLSGKSRTGGGKEKPIEPLRALAQFGRNKLAPVPADLVDVLSHDRKKGLSWDNAGKDSVGNTLTGTDLLLRNLAPITYSNLASKAVKEGLDPEDLLQVLDLFGISVNRYAKKKGQ